MMNCKPASAVTKWRFRCSRRRRSFLISHLNRVRRSSSMVWARMRPKRLVERASWRDFGNVYICAVFTERLLGCAKLGLGITDECDLLITSISSTRNTHTSEAVTFARSGEESSCLTTDHDEPPAPPFSKRRKRQHPCSRE